MAGMVVKIKTLALKASATKSWVPSLETSVGVSMPPAPAALPVWVKLFWPRTTLAFGPLVEGMGEYRRTRLFWVSATTRVVPAAQTPSGPLKVDRVDPAVFPETEDWPTTTLAGCPFEVIARLLKIRTRLFPVSAMNSLLPSPLTQ